MLESGGPEHNHKFTPVHILNDTRKEIVEFVKKNPSAHITTTTILRGVHGELFQNRSTEIVAQFDRALADPTALKTILAKLKKENFPSGLHWKGLLNIMYQERAEVPDVRDRYIQGFCKQLISKTI